MLDQLLPSRRQFSADDLIFGLHAQAQARRRAGEDILDVTLGTLADDGGDQVVLEPVMELWRELEPADVAAYAPIAGDPGYLRAMVQRHWPGVEGPVTGCATPGGSGALALSVRNFLEPGMAVLAAAPFWGPYAVLASENGAALATAPFPSSTDAFDLEAWERQASALLSRQKRLLVWLNEPCHNPTGRSFTAPQRRAFIDLLSRLGDKGPVTLILDCAYLDYTPEPGHAREALDQYEALGAEGKVLVGASLSLSKAFTLYGVRAGALVFPWCRDEVLQAALTTSCRGVFSSCSRAAQALLLRLERDGRRQERLNADHRHWSVVLEGRAAALNQALAAEGLEGSPWMGGFFMTLKPEDPAGTCARLRDLGVYAVPMSLGIRIGLCAMPAAGAPRLAQALRRSL